MFLPVEALDSQVVTHLIHYQLARQRRRWIYGMREIYNHRERQGRAKAHSVGLLRGARQAIQCISGRLVFRVEGQSLPKFLGGLTLPVLPFQD